MRLHTMCNQLHIVCSAKFEEALGAWPPTLTPAQNTPTPWAESRWPASAPGSPAPAPGCVPHSSLANPGRSTWPGSIWRIHLRSVSGEQPIFSAIERIAAVNRRRTTRSNASPERPEIANRD